MFILGGWWKGSILLFGRSEDLAVIGMLILLEGLLSADNALILAMQVRHLAADRQKKALLYGIFGAVLLRGLGLLLAKQIINLWWLCAAGSLYLIVLSIRHFIGKHQENGVKPVVTGPGFWQTVLMVELTDMVFAVDSILVAVALSNKLWVIYTGAFLGILLLRLAAGMFIRLLEKYPRLDDLAYLLVGWAGVKLSGKAIELFLVSTRRYDHVNVPRIVPPWLFWVGMAVIVVGGAIFAVRSGQAAKAAVDTGEGVVEIPIEK